MEQDETEVVLVLAALMLPAVIAVLIWLPAQRTRMLVVIVILIFAAFIRNPPKWCRFLLGGDV